MKYISLTDAILKATMEENYGYLDKEDLKSIPSVDIVRCKNCKYSDRIVSVRGNTYYFCTYNNSLWVNPEFFCASGKERV